MKKLFFLEKIDSSQSGEENAYYFELIQFRVSVTHFSSSQGKIVLLMMIIHLILGIYGVFGIKTKLQCCFYPEKD